jgi:hypothetical protein
METGMSRRQSYQQSESLQSVVLDLVRDQLAVFLTIWLAVVVPISCDHHAIMGLFDIDSMVEPQVGHAGHAEHIHADALHAGGVHDGSAGHAVDGHHPSSLVSLMLTLTGVVPVMVIAEAQIQMSAVVAAPRLPGHDVQQTPPEPPPRAV